MVENIDYVRFTQKGEANNATMIEYALTIEAAKELSMVEGNAKGKQARQYFIDMEKKVLSSVAVMEPEEMLLQSVQLMIEQKKRIAAIERKVEAIDARTATRPDMFTIMGYAIISHVQVSLTTAAKLGRKAKAICDQRNLQVDEIPDARFGRVRVYPTHVLEEVFSQEFKG